MTESFLKNRTCYHVSVNGPSEHPVFRRMADYTGYLRLLKRYRSRFTVSIFGFCLLAERVHLILCPSSVEGLSAFVHCVSDSYEDHFNKKYERQGKLWPGKARFARIDSDRELFECIKYVEFIPVRLGLVNSSVEYPWSSCSLRVLGYSGGVGDSRLRYQEKDLFEPNLTGGSHGAGKII